MNFTSALTPQPSRFSLSLLHNDVAAPKWMQRTGPPVVVRQEANNNNMAFRGERESHRFCGALKVRKIVFLYVETVSPPVM
jgi:hypothetical protein